MSDQLRTDKRVGDTVGITRPPGRHPVGDLKQRRGVVIVGRVAFHDLEEEDGKDSLSLTESPPASVEAPLKKLLAFLRA